MMENRVAGGIAGVRDEERLNELLSAAPRPGARREVRVGFFVLAGFMAVIIALFTLTDVSALRNRYVVTTVVPDAGGIRKGDPVQMLGVNIGRVRGFDIAPGGVSVRLELQREYPVPVDSRVELVPSGLLGGTVAEVMPGSARETAGRGALLAGASGPGLMDAAGELGIQAEDVLARFQAALSDQTVGAVSAGALELQQLIADVAALAAQQRQELGDLSASLRRSAAGVEQATTAPELMRSVQRLDALTARLDETIGSLDRAGTSLESVMARVDRGEGTLGKLSRDEELYDNLARAAADLSLLAIDIRENPGRYINLRIF